MTLEEFLSLPKLSESFPVAFDNGVRWDDLKGQCGSCGTDLPDEHLRGEVSRFSSVFVVRASGFCEPCNHLTGFAYRLHADAGMTGISPSTGEWTRWEAKRPWYTFLRRMWPKSSKNRRVISSTSSGRTIGL